MKSRKVSNAKANYTCESTQIMIVFMDYSDSELVDKKSVYTGKLDNGLNK